MNSKTLQQYIIDNNLVPTILTDLRCKNIRESDKEYRSTKPDGNNPTSLAVSKKDLKVYCYSDNWHGNIYTLCMNTLHLSFGQTMKYLHALFGLIYEYSPWTQDSATTSALNVFTQYQNRNLFDNSILNTEIPDIELPNYEPYLHINWIKEGITERAKERFDIQYDGNRKKIIIPHRHYETGKIVGVMSRTTVPFAELFGIPKYYPIIPYAKGNNLYGLYENYESIIEAGYVVVYEAEKSVLKRCSRHDDTGVAVCTHSITNVQAEILISLNVDIIIAWDKDVGEKDIFKSCNKFKGIRNVYYIQDTEGILGEKDSPADASEDNFQKLLKNKKKYA